MYKLYVGRTQKIPDNIRFSIYDSTHGEILVFTDEQVPETFRFVGEEHYGLLTAEQKRWLLESKLTVNTEEIVKRADEYAEILDKFVDLFEEELKKEQKDGRNQA